MGYQVMFPEYDRDYMERLLRHERDFERTVDQLLQGNYPRNGQSGRLNKDPATSSPSKGSGSAFGEAGNSLSRRLSGGRSIKSRISKMFTTSPAPVMSGPSGATQQPMVKHTPAPCMQGVDL